jgi:hypothetical protein
MGFGSHVGLLSFRKFRVEMLRLARERRKLGLSATGTLFWQEHITVNTNCFVFIPFIHIGPVAVLFSKYLYGIPLRRLDI